MASTIKTYKVTRKAIKPRLKYIVIVEHSSLQKDVFGPYTTFSSAEGDAKAWGGSVHPIQKPSEHKF